GDQHLALFLESAHAAAIGLRGAAEQDHWPTILLGIGQAGETVHHAGAGHNDAGAGAPGQIAVGLRRVGGGLLVAHADIGNAFLLRGCGNRGDRKPDDPEQVIDALMFEAPRYQGRAVDFAHTFLLVREARDYALMARPRKGFCRAARHLAVLHDAHARNRRLLVDGREPSALMKSRRRIAFPKLGTRPSSASNSGCQNRKLRPAKWDPKVQLRCGVLEPLMAAKSRRFCFVRIMSAFRVISEMPM